MKIRRTIEDGLFSDFIRKRAMLRGNACEYCGKAVTSYQELQCSHFVGRRSASTRFDPDNCVGVCFHCHQWFDEHHHEHNEFYKKLLGSERFEQLIIRGNIILKPNPMRNPENKKKFREEMRRKIKELDND